MAGEVFRKHGMLHLNPPPDTDAIVWSVIGVENKVELIKAPVIDCYASFSFHTTNTITIHMSNDNDSLTKTKRLGMYLEKLLLLEKIFAQAKVHLDEGLNESLLIKEFLSGEEDPTSGSSVQIYIPIETDSWLDQPCIFDISDCFKKHRSTLTRDRLKTLLDKLLTELRAHMVALGELYDIYKESIK